MWAMWPMGLLLIHNLSAPDSTIPNRYFDTYTRNIDHMMGFLPTTEYKDPWADKENWKTMSFYFLKCRLSRVL